MVKIDMFDEMMERHQITSDYLKTYPKDCGSYVKEELMPVVHYFIDK